MRSKGAKSSQEKNSPGKKTREEKGIEEPQTMSESFFQDFPEYPNGEHVEALFDDMEKTELVEGQIFDEGKGYSITKKGVASLSLLLALYEINKQEGEDNDG